MDFRERLGNGLTCHLLFHIMKCNIALCAQTHMGPLGPYYRRQNCRRHETRGMYHEY